MVQGFLLLGVYEGLEVYHPLDVATFIVISGNELSELSLRAMPAPALKVEEWGENLILSVAQNAL